MIGLCQHVGADCIQSRDLPLLYCTMVTPSGHLSSEWLRPDILSLEGIWANYIALRNGGGDKPHSHCRTNCESLNGSTLHHNIGIGEDGQVKPPNEGQQLFQYLCNPSSNPSLRLGEEGGGRVRVRHEATVQSRDGQKPCSCQVIRDIAQKTFNLRCNLPGIP